MTPSSGSVWHWPLVALGIVVVVAVALALRARQAKPAVVVPQADLQRYPHFVFAKVIDSLMPIERGDKYEDPLSDSLEARRLGEVTGGGTQLDKDNKVEWIGIDMQLADLDGAVELVRQRLRELGAPAGSVLQFKRDGQDVTLPVH